jgi:hypothetical protein
MHVIFCVTHCIVLFLPRSKFVFSQFRMSDAIEVISISSGGVASGIVAADVAVQHEYPKVKVELGLLSS